MIELFTDIPDYEKQMVELLVNLALLQDDLFKAGKMLEDYRKLCDEELQEYMDFYFYLKLEELRRENPSNQR